MLYGSGTNAYQIFQQDLVDAIFRVFHKYNVDGKPPLADKSDFDRVVEYLEKRDFFNSWGNDGSVEDKEFNTYNAVDSAFPKLDNKIKNIITRWYETEDAIDDFNSVEEFAEYIKMDIYEMLDAADEDEQQMVSDALEKSGY